MKKKLSDHSNKDNLQPLELQKYKVYSIIEILKYAPDSVLNKTIIKRTTGNITVSSFDAGQGLTEKTSSFDIYIQVIEGTAGLIISEKKYKIKTGDGIIIPAHSKHGFIAMKRFKMISTIIKSGYEEFA